MKPKTYQTPKRHCVIKTRLTEAERADFEQRCSTLSMSQSEYIRQAIFYSCITPVIRVNQNSEELLTSVSSLVAQYGKIGSNLNQIARYLNEGSSPYQGLSRELREAAADLAALKFDVLKVIGEAYGNDKTYQL
ncbi:plasmid mobilization protein [Enterocloster bolteae]|uniref:plasmid mobilization protein n=1 Tax=Enterocloster bolteae TaxID=208479 RepID=UPI00189EEBF7|nr:plasmid mobilization relaxosome protein MobC [Enterocloster bolteae]